MPKKKKGKGKKNNKEPKKEPKITVIEYLLYCGMQKKLRLTDNSNEWMADNRDLKTQVDSLRSELDATISYLRRQEGAERRACQDEVATRDGDLREAETQLHTEQHSYERAEFELSEELREGMIEAADREEQVSFWKNYPFIQNIEKREKIKLLKSGIRHVDEIYDAFEVQLDGNFRYMQAFLMSGHARRLERTKHGAAYWALQRVSLSDHSDLAAQPTLCLQSVLSHQLGDTLRDQLDGVDEENAALQRSLVPLRRLEPPPPPSAAPWRAGSAASSDAGGVPLRLHLESITHLLAAARPSDAERALVDRLRDATLQRLRPDEDEQRARALAKLVQPAASECGSAGSSAESGSGSDDSRLSQDELLPFESPIQVATAVRRQTLRPFERWARRRHWWRVQQPQPRPRTWPVTGPHLALYADRPPVFDLAGPKVINESPSVSSAHISDEWELCKGGWLEHLQRRSVLSVTPTRSADTLSAASRADSSALAKGSSSRGVSVRGSSYRGAAARGSSSRGVVVRQSSSRGVMARGSFSRGTATRESSSKKLTTGASSSKSVTKRSSSKAITEA